MSSNVCVNCPAFSTNDAGDDPSGVNTACACEANRFVQNNQCILCTEGGDTNSQGDLVPGPDTSCDRLTIVGSACTIFEGATGNAGDPFFTQGPGSCSKRYC